MYRRGNTLVACSQMEAEDLATIPEGRIVSVTWTRSRSSKQERYLRGLVAIVAQGMGLDPRTQWNRIKRSLGMVHYWNDEDGVEHEELFGTSRDDMDADEYNVFTTRVIDHILTNILPGIPKREIALKVERYLRISPEADVDDPGH